MKCYLKLILFLLCGAQIVDAQLTVTVYSPRVYGEKAVVEIDMKNSFSQSVESARATTFLLDGQGKIVGQSTKWIIGGSKDMPGLAANGMASYNFVITTDHPFATTNLAAKVTVNRLVLQDGKLADVAKDVQITTAQK